MKKAEIKVGGLYHAKVSGQIVTVRVERIEEAEINRTYGSGVYSNGNKRFTHYFCTNLRTGREIRFRSAAKFRNELVAHPNLVPKNGMCNRVGCDRVGSPREGLKGWYCDEHFAEGTKKLAQAAGMLPQE